ncbi:LIM domain-binding protein 2 [Cichlidogyrus casuarinus]|uniref:LIM domain-binding protein 2 n=1 Tax=Cichlidogyrus casuarinus TaxID=1844966 RepID=A0ABD2QLJ4_9PLAT
MLNNEYEITTMAIFESVVETQKDPLQKIEDELQKRIGNIPLLDNVSPVLVVKPRAYSEISRAVRSARTMRLCVRACGRRSSNNIETIIAHLGSVLIDCSSLKDQPPICKIRLRRKGQVGEEPGLRVMAGVTLEAAINFMVDNCIELQQSCGTDIRGGTVVSAVICGRHGLSIDKNPYVGSCLADEVLSIRLIDHEGDLVEYSSEEEVKYAATNYGTLGVVYDVTFKYSDLTVCRVNYEYQSLGDVISGTSMLERLDRNWITELVYIPFNQYCSSTEEWEPLRDLVLVKNAVKLESKADEPEEPLSSEPRFQVPIVDPVFGPSETDYLDAAGNFDKTKKLMQHNFEYQRIQTLKNPFIRQLTPWALNSIMKIVPATRAFTLTVLLSQELTDFDKVIILSHLWLDTIIRVN